MRFEDKKMQQQELREQVDRILSSDEFRSSGVLCRLLSYLTDKALSGEADQLKEYTIAIEGLGKPDTYDPQHNASVRILVGRLRQKLGQYYHTEGKEDPFIVDLPKGRFRLTCEPREIALPVPQVLAVAELDLAPDGAGKPPAKASPRFLLRILPGLGLLLALLAGAFFLGRETSLDLRGAGSAWPWTSDLEALWGPLTISERPFILVIEDPLFVELRSTPRVYYRDQSLNQWKDLLNSSDLKLLTSRKDGTDIQPSRYYTSFGEAETSLLLGKFLGPREKHLSLVRASQLSWQQVADNNVAFVGAQNLFFDQLKGMPFEAQLIPSVEGIRNVHPRPGEPAMFADQYSLAPSEEGIIYGLVTLLPGPLRQTNVLSFTSSRSTGRLGAVQSFTDASFAREIVTKLKAAAGGKMPRYYQVLLKIKFKDNIPTETSYILCRILN